MQSDKTCIEGVGFADALRRNPNFDELKQMNKQTGSIGKNASKPAVFLGRNKFCLRIPLGKRLCFPNLSAIRKSVSLQPVCSLIRLHFLFASNLFSRAFNRHKIIGIIYLSAISTFGFYCVIIRAENQKTPSAQLYSKAAAA